MKEKDIQNPTLVVGDIEWNLGHFRQLMANPRLIDIWDNISTILVWDVVWGVKDWNLSMLKHCYENSAKIRMILWNKDLLVQEIISGTHSGKIPAWASRLANDLDEKKNRKLRDYFMNEYIPYIKEGIFRITHARPIQGKKLSEHSKKDLVWGDGRKNRKPVHKTWKVFIYWHHATEGLKINRHWKYWEVSSIQIDSGCWRWTWNLSAVLLWWEQVELLDSGWFKGLIDL